MTLQVLPLFNTSYF